MAMMAIKNIEKKKQNEISKIMLWRQQNNGEKK